MKLRPTSLRLLLMISICVSVGLAVAGCPNQGGAAASAGSGISTGLPSSVSGASGGSGSTVPKNSTASFTMVTAIAQLPPGASGGSGTSGASASPSDPPPNFTLVFNATNTQNTLNDFCQASSGGASGASGNATGDPSKSCLCQFTWPVTNTSSSSTITRVVQTQPTQVTNFEVQCPGPDVYNDPDELPDNTIIKIQLVPDTNNGNNSGFQTNVVNFTKQPIGATGDFRDAEGRAFRNIFHYSCFDIQSKNLTITHSNKVFGTNSVTNNPINAFASNSFDLGGGNSPTAFSAQSYYFDFYIRSNESGSVNGGSTGTGGFSCPQVNVNGTPSYFPMDSSFALALQQTSDFPVAIAGRTTILTPGTAGGTVIGYAAVPNADGSCPSFADSSGKLQRTFRLRQYSALYPIRYEASGDLHDQSQPQNTIYILDRPVDRLSQDPLKPMTRIGPKPCPFSFMTAQFGQKCMTDASLTGWSIDGTQIDGSAKCPIYPPPDPTNPNLLKSDGTLVIRPFRPFLPHYLENTTLRACAFQSTIAIDPEIVLSHDDNIFPGNAGPTDFWCAKYYPPSGSIIPSSGAVFNKSPGDCDLLASASAIKTDKTYACAKAYNTTNTPLVNPAAGCCQICSGPDCTAQGGGKTPQGRNAVFTPPRDPTSTGGVNPPQAQKTLPRAQPNVPAANAAGGVTGCFDPYEP